MRAGLMVAIGFGVLAGVMAIQQTTRTEPPAPQTPGPRAWPDHRQASPLVASRLRDPASASYRRQTVEYRGQDRIVCGEVNARNGLGGMAGFSKFLVVDQAVFMEGDEGFSPVWREYCTARQ